ncbi:hypothetical protein GCM10010412_090800 [Nonomuraea recticatena]|uniref:Uncharacterized protein n=1 Tax=Nonomuraea recticatena TaxID=46178 RepID=A0ABP6FQP6_9ACTN
MVPLTEGMKVLIPTLVAGGPDVTTSTADKLRRDAHFLRLDIPFTMAMPHFRADNIDSALERSVTIFSRDANRHPVELSNGATLSTRRPITEYTSLPDCRINA